MKSILVPAFALAMAAATPAAFCADATEHEQHHPEAATTKPAPGAQKPTSKPAAQKQNMEQMAKMDAHMKTMREMHEKMMNAKTQEERNALMAEHMKTMQEGMSMMQGMRGGMMGGMKGGMMGGQSSGKAASPQDMQMQMNMMQKQMDMMQTMMQMMMDRMGPPAPAK